LSRAKFDPVDLHALIGRLIEQREARGWSAASACASTRPTRARRSSWAKARGWNRCSRSGRQRLVLLARSGVVAISLAHDHNDLIVRVEDEAPASRGGARGDLPPLPLDPPAAEDFGRHSGLGLAIARTIVEAHQGRIHVESREDRMSGARFVVRLPLAPVS
jgi:two-component system sensor histidine kinase ChvG